ncbi:hypothetical protein HK405_015181, partial [Cladochytrium tenue]
HVHPTLISGDDLDDVAISDGGEGWVNYESDYLLDAPSPRFPFPVTIPLVTVPAAESPKLASPVAWLRVRPLPFYASELDPRLPWHCSWIDDGLIGSSSAPIDRCHWRALADHSVGLVVNLTEFPISPSLAACGPPAVPALRNPSGDVISSMTCPTLCGTTTTGVGADDTVRVLFLPVRRLGAEFCTAPHIRAARARDVRRRGAPSPYAGALPGGRRSHRHLPRRLSPPQTKTFALHGEERHSGPSSSSWTSPLADSAAADVCKLLQERFVER